MHDYSSRVQSLLTRGEPEANAGWAYYHTFLNQANIPELIQMATDLELHTADGESARIWAPLHAWRALGQLHAVDAVEPLVRLFEKSELEDDDWIHDEIPEVLALIGPGAVPALADYLNGHENNLHGRCTVTTALALIGKRHALARSECVRVLTSCLEQAENEFPELNGWLVVALLDLDARESAAVIERAFEADAVDCSIVGDLYDVLEALGLSDQCDASDAEDEDEPAREPPPSKKSHFAGKTAQLAAKERKARRRKALQVWKRFCKRR